MEKENPLKKLAIGLKAVIAEFAGETSKPSESQNFNEVKTQDGQLILSYDGEMPMANMPLFILDEAGQRLPAPDGDYVIEDGSTLKVSKGVITEVVAGTAEAPAEEALPVEQAEQTPANTQAQAPVQTPKAVVESIVKEYRFQEQLDELKASLEAKDKTIAELTEKFNAQVAENEKHKQAFGKLAELVTAIADEPAKPTTVEKKDGFKKNPIKEDKSDFEKKVAEFHKSVFK